MADIVLGKEARRILEFVCRTLPVENPPEHFQNRTDISGELRLSLAEYDDACRQLTREHLIVTDPPNAPDCDWIAPSAKGRQVVG
jgi:hypothetical protein